MRFDYALTVDDIRDASRPTGPDGRPRRGRSPVRAALGWVVFLAMLALILFMLRLAPGRAPAWPLQNAWVTLTPNPIPATIMVLAVGIPALRQRVYTRRALAAIADGRPAPALGNAGAWQGLVILAPMALVYLWDSPEIAVYWHPSPAAAVWAGLAPWGVAGTLIALIGAGSARTAAQRTWATNPGARRPMTVDVSDDGVRTTTAASESLYRWVMFTRYRETAALLVLTLEDGRTFIVPKRALSDAVAEDQLRSLIQSHVAEGTFLPRDAAFPVQPLPVVEVAE